jgi:hypothetical protein
VRTLGRIALTLGTLAVLGYFVAAISAQTEIGAFDEPGTAGKFGIHTTLGFALVLGWALGSAVEAAWDNDKETTEWWAPFAFAALPRLFGGVVLLFVVVFIAAGFEALGVGLGGQ